MEEPCTLRAGALLGLNEFEAKESLEHWLQRKAGLYRRVSEGAILQQAHASALLRTISVMRQDLTALRSRSTNADKLLVK
ncbi:hypothetical protein [Cupriavidus alkaliphilus]|uniref:hypothetical protein n=1 Tax=Cupriavidus alkaliphilus TaxID=942866 RepID=UPI00339D73A1